MPAGILYLVSAVMSVVRLYQRPDLHILRFAGEDLVLRARGPGEVMDIFGVVVVSGRPIAVVDGLHLQAGRTQYEVFGNRHPHVVDPVVGEELRVVVKLVSVPFSTVVDGDLRKPLADEEVLFLGAGARKRRRRELGSELEVEGHPLTRCERFR